MSDKQKIGSEFFTKIDQTEIFEGHLNTLKNYRQNKYSVADLLIFFVFPLILSLVVVFANLKLNKDLIGILINVFAIFAGFLFNLLVLVYEAVSKAIKQDSTVQENSLSLDRLEAIFSNISFEVTISVFNVLLLAISAYFVEGIVNTILSFIVFYLVILFTLTLFMILKRIHKLLSEEIKHQRNLLANRP